MCDGAASLMSMFFDMAAAGRWTEQRESNFLDGGAHFYGVYECGCGRFISIGSIEPQFYALLRQHAGLSDADFDAQMDRKAWPALKQKLVDVFKTKTRDEWCTIMEGTDVCFAPILTMAEAPAHPHNAAREIFVTRHGVIQPAPAPRFSRTPSAIRDAATADIGELMSEWKGGRERHLPSFRGASKASEPGIHNHDREYGFRRCAKGCILRRAIAHRGMTTIYFPPKCQSLISVTRSTKVRTLADNSREVG